MIMNKKMNKKENNNGGMMATVKCAAKATAGMIADAAIATAAGFTAGAVMKGGVGMAESRYNKTQPIVKKGMLGGKKYFDPTTGKRVKTAPVPFMKPETRRTVNAGIAGASVAVGGVTFASERLDRRELNGTADMIERTVKGYIGSDIKKEQV